MKEQAIAPESSTRFDRLEMQRMERRARNFWVTGVVSMLGLQVLGGITAVMLSAGDPSTAVVPNYHRAALDWDITHREQQLVQRLGWQVSTDVGRINASGRRFVAITIIDGKLAPVRGLKVAAKVYHHSRGRQVDEVMLTETADGHYTAETGLQKPGLWQLEMKIEGEHGIAAVSRELEVL